MNKISRKLVPFMRAGGYGLILGGLTLAGCSTDEPGGPDDGLTAVQLTASVSGADVTATGTRTTNGGDSWTTDDAIGVFMIKPGGSLSGDIVTIGKTPSDNIEYHATPGSPDSVATFSPASTTLYYPQSGSMVWFIAYYPYTGSTGTAPREITPDYNYIVTVEGQTDEAALNDRDVLWAKTTGASKSDPAVNFVFSHVLSKVTLNVIAGDGVDDTDIAAMTRNDVVISGMPLTASLDLDNGTLSDETIADFNPVMAATPSAGASATFTALLIPQVTNGYSGRSIVFTVGGGTYTWDIPDVNPFRAGRHYTYTVKVNKIGVTVDSGTISDWTVNDNGDNEPDIILKSTGRGVIIRTETGSTEILYKDENLAEGLQGAYNDIPIFYDPVVQGPTIYRGDPPYYCEKEYGDNWRLINSDELMALMTYFDFFYNIWASNSPMAQQYPIPYYTLEKRQQAQQWLEILTGYNLSTTVLSDTNNYKDILTDNSLGFVDRYYTPGDIMIREMDYPGGWPFLSPPGTSSDVWYYNQVNVQYKAFWNNSGYVSPSDRENRDKILYDEFKKYDYDKTVSRCVRTVN